MAKKNDKLIVWLMRGLPSSGKSTRAEELVVLQEHGPTARVNKDSIREMVCYHKRGDKFRKDFSWEKQVQESVAAVARVFLSNGFNIVVDDTNLKPYHEEFWRKVAYEFKGKLEVISFLDIPVEECVRRDALRENPVGAGAIYSLAASIGLIESANMPVDIPEGYVAWDLDGTLCDISHRLHFIQGGNADWDSFFQEMPNDKPREHIIGMRQSTYGDRKAVVVTARWEAYRYMTEQWLLKHDFKYDALLMRKPNDKRPDSIVKQEMIDTYMKKEQIALWVDDRARVLVQIRVNNIQTMNVGDGSDF